MRSANVAVAMDTARAPRPSPAAMWLCAAAIALSLGLRLVYFAQPWRIDFSTPPAFLAAEGIVGLMARHILRGARPVFYYGQYYMGALEAYLTAGVFKLFGPSMTTLRVVPTVFTLAWIPLAGAIAGRLYGRRAAFLAAAAVALPSQFIFEWGFRAWGHAEHVTMMLLSIYVLIRVLEYPSNAALISLGVITGLSLWMNQLAAAYIPLYAGALWLWGKLDRTRVVLLMAAGLIGFSPMIYANVKYPLATVRSMLSKARASYRQAGVERETEPDEPVEQGPHRALPLLQVLGAQPRADGQWSPLGTLGAAFLLFGTAAGGYRAYARRRQEPFVFRCSMLLLACAAMTILLGIGGFFGQPVGRYQLLLYPLVCALAVGGLEQVVPRAAVAVIAMLAVAQALQLAAPLPPDGRTAATDIVRALDQHGLQRGYGADYMYDLVFQSGERVLIDPLPYSRYVPYEAAIAAADRIFYLYRDEQQAKVAHRAFMTQLATAGVQYREFRVGEYHVLYDFDPRAAISGTSIARLREQIQRRKGHSVSRQDES